MIQRIKTRRVNTTLPEETYIKMTVWLRRTKHKWNDILKAAAEAVERGEDPIKLLRGRSAGAASPAPKQP